MKKKLLSIWMCISVWAAGFIIPVSATAGDTESTYTFDGYTSAEYTLPDGWSEVNGYSNNTSDNRIHVLSENGAFGKASDDTAYKIAPYWHTNDTKARWYQTRYTPNAQIDNKRYVKVSYEMAVNLTDVYRWFQISFKNSGDKEQPAPNFFEIKKENGVCVLYAGGEKLNYDIPAEKWMRFDAVCDLVDRTVDLYVDGEKVKEDFDLGITADVTLTALNQFLYGVNILKNDAGTAYNASQTYLDNVAYVITDTQPEITAYTAPDTIDFQNYESGAAPKAYNANAKAYEDFLTVSPSDRQSFAAYDGLRGKATSDRSLRIKAESGRVLSGDGSTPQYTQYRLNTNTTINTSSTPYFHFSTEFAMEGASMNRAIYLQTNNSVGGTMVAESPIIEIYLEDGEQVVKVAGTKTDLQLPMSVLMKFDIVVNREARTFDLYINGEKKFENQPTKADYIGAVTQIQLYSRQIWQFTPEKVWLGEVVPWNGYTASDTYYDNMDWGKYYTYPAITKYTSPTVTALKSYDEEVAPIDGMKQYDHSVPLCGYDSEYYYYAQMVSMPQDGATRAYKATLVGPSNESVLTEKNIFEVKNGEAKAFDKEFGDVVPTEREFKLSFLFDIVNKTYNVYIDDVPVVIEMPFGMTDTVVTGFSSIQSYVTAEGATCNVKETPLESGAYITIPRSAQYEQYAVESDDTTATVKILSNLLSGIPILAVYHSDMNMLKDVVVGEVGQREISVKKEDGSKIKFMLWNNFDDMKPVINSFYIN